MPPRQDGSKRPDGQWKDYPMKDPDRTRIADDLAELATRVAVALSTVDTAGRTVVNRIREAMLGQPGAQNLEGDRTTGHTTVTDEHGYPMPSVSDPTGEAAIRHDRAAAHLKELDKVLFRARDHMQRATDILAAYTPRPATDYEQRQLDMDNDPGCESCSRVEVAKGVAQWQPVHVVSRCKGNLKEKRALCWWCYEWVLSTGALPTVEQVQAHHDGRRVRRPA